MRKIPDFGWWRCLNLIRSSDKMIYRTFQDFFSYVQKWARRMYPLLSKSSTPTVNGVYIACIISIHWEECLPGSRELKPEPMEKQGIWLDKRQSSICEGIPFPPRHISICEWEAEHTQEGTSCCFHDCTPDLPPIYRPLQKVFHENFCPTEDSLRMPLISISKLHGGRCWIRKTT